MYPFRKAPPENEYCCWAIRNETANDSPYHASFSPCGMMLAFATKKIVSLSFLNFGELSHKEILSHHASLFIEDVKWSLDSKALMLVSYETHSIEIINIESPDHLFTIQGTRTIRLISSAWSPDCNHVITALEHGIYSAVYSLSCEHHFIPSISICKYGRPLMVFSPNGMYLAVVAYIKSCHHLLLISTASWRVLWARRLDAYLMSGLLWSCDSLMIATWSNISEHTVYFFELSGLPKKGFKHFDPAISSIETLKFSPCSTLLALQCDDSSQHTMVLLYNLLTWRLAAVLDYSTSCEETLRSSGILFECFLKPDESKSSKLCRIELAFSTCGGFLAIPESNNLVSVWSTHGNINLCSVLHPGCAVLDLKWHPRKPHLALACGLDSVLLWKYCQKDRQTNNLSEVSLIKIGVGCAFNIQWSSNSLLVSPKGESVSKTALILVKQKKSRK